MSHQFFEKKNEKTFAGYLRHGGDVGMGLNLGFAGYLGQPIP